MKIELGMARLGKLPEYCSDETVVVTLSRSRSGSWKLYSPHINVQQEKEESRNETKSSRSTKEMLKKVSENMRE